VDIVCPVCRSAPADDCLLSGPDRLHGTPGTFCVALCGSCGAGWTLPPASPEQLESFYPASYHAYALDRGLLGRAQDFARRMLLERALRRSPLQALADRPAGLVVDVGCGRGDLGVAFMRHGWQVLGIEPSASACVVARSRGIDARVGTLESVGLEDESADAVIMNHSLEHLPDPLGALAHVHRLLRPGGLLVISLPNFACWQRKRFRSAWFHLDLPRHRMHFASRSLELALSNAGFVQLSISTTSESGALFATLQYALFGRLIFGGGLAAWAGYGITAVLAPASRILDWVHGQPALLHAVAWRDAHDARGSTPQRALAYRDHGSREKHS
jgi:SAM-dependent methyltransferase